VPREQSPAFGVMTTSDGKHIDEFLEKPTDPPGLPGEPDVVLASMGNYVFSTDVLLDAVKRDAYDDGSVHDMGGNVIPALVEAGAAHVYDFADNIVPGATERDAGYWRDVGTIDAYHDAHMDLVSVHPVFNLYNRKWPILTHSSPLPPAKFVHDEPGRTGHAIESLVSPGCIVSGGNVRGSVLSPGVHIHSNAEVVDSVLLNGVDVGRGARLRRVIIDKGVVVPPGVSIGIDHDADRARGFHISAGGVVVLGKGQHVPTR
jgi:glucose-1-phosphate adenylyltransferase